MLLDGAIVLVVGSTVGLDFIVLQLISSHCRVYVSGRPNESQALKRAKSRIHDIQLYYLTGDETSESESDDDEASVEDVVLEFLRRERRLDLVIFSSADNEERSIKYLLPTLMETSKHNGSANVIIMKSATKKPRTRMDSLRKIKGHGQHDEQADCESDDGQAETVKAKLDIVLLENDAQNVFVNATNPDQLLSVILQYSEYRQHHLVEHDVPSSLPASASLGARIQ